MNDLDPAINKMMKDEPKPEPVPEIAPEPEPSSKILLWAIGIILVLVIGVFAIRAFYTPSEPRGEIVMYNNFEFEKHAGLWRTLWQLDSGTQLILDFHYTPQETLNITPKVLPTWNASKFDNEKLVIAFDPRTEDQTYVQLSATELAFKLAAIGVNVSSAYTVNATGDFPERPIVNCNTPNQSVIIVQDFNSTAGIQLQKTCVTLYGGKDELVRATDRLLYTIYGIMPSLTPPTA